MIRRTFWLNRTACDVLEELRVYLRSTNMLKGPAESLIEELQIMYNRMESALADKRQIKEINEERHKIKEKYKDLLKKIKDAGGEFEDE